MTDKQLLEYAAKAVGFAGALDFLNTQMGKYWVRTYGYWNPLTDDGDALRLAVKLKMRIGIDSLQEGFVIVMSSDKLTPDTHETINNDIYTATRKAIVRAAAKIGEKEQ